MAFREPYTTVDGFTALTKGMHSGLDPLLLDSNGQYAYGINVTTRGGFAKTRPAFVDLGKLDGSGTFQGASAYSLDESDHLAYAVGGRVYVRNGTTGAISEITDPTAVSDPLDAKYLSPTAEHVYFAQVFRWMVAQDGSSRPIVAQESGGVFSRLARDYVIDFAAMDDEYLERMYSVPRRDFIPNVCYVPGTIGIYAHGRYHYVPEIVPDALPALEMNKAGDPPGAAAQSFYLNEDAVPIPVKSTTAAVYPNAQESGKACFISSDVLDPLQPLSVFRMTEHRGLDEGGAYALPAELGFIHGMGAMRGAATGTGVGSLYVFGSRGVSAFEVSVPRASTGSTGKSWKDIAFSQVAFHGAGTYSPFSIVNLNDDIWYVDASKNMRSVSYDTSQLGSGGYAGAAMFNTTKSFESKRWVEKTLDAYRPFISSAVADNRLHWTLCAGKAIGSIDFAQAYTATPSELPIIHEGVWTGFDFKRVLSLNGVLHAIVLASDGLHLLKLDETAASDPKSTPVESTLVTKMYSGVYNETYTLGDPKKLLHVDILVSGITMPTTLEVYFRPIHYPVWTKLGEEAFNVPAGSAAQVRAKVRMAVNPARPFGCAAATKEPLHVANAFQFKLVWRGRAQISRFTAFASQFEEPPRLQCQADNVSSVSYPAEEFDDLEYEVKL